MSKKICLIDTSILTLIFRVPNYGSEKDFDNATNIFEAKKENKETIYLPMATLIETGNHIGQISDGDLRRERATLFMSLIKQGLDKNEPFAMLTFLKEDQLKEWIDSFPDYASAQVGFGDLSIIKDLELIKKENKNTEVYIWTIDSDFNE